MSNPFNTGPDVAVIEATAAIERAENGTLTLIDVRETAELQMSGRAKGALHIPMDMVPAQLDPNSPEVQPDLTRDTPLALYCASGARSHVAAQYLMQLGYTEVYNLGGLRDWAMADGPIER